MYLPTGLFDEVVQNQQALLLYNLSFHVVYLVLSLADIVSLLLGLHYVLHIRAELKALRNHEGGLVVQSTASQLVQASSSLLPASANPSASQAPPLVNSKQSKWVQRQEKSAGIALFWILFNLALLVAYLCVMLIPEVLMSLPIQFVFALLTLILKLFVTGMTFSIRAMTSLVKARNRIQS
ncbi:hypothetical protein BCR44DRAFT_37360 [Catenaria anguillulae PL171]|uniref:Uncharacterized protein n=1 Tax=Catenaria anguillulae PL171 TaxID=765915 RepID=A0A1Y2HRQ5_9FUNG|nr:hypothetical protein BCR44DRAFT_37360 [Catenaria anguillulae PL171]